MSKQERFQTAEAWSKRTFLGSFSWAPHVSMLFFFRIKTDPVIIAYILAQMEFANLICLNGLWFVKYFCRECWSTYAFSYLKHSLVVKCLMKFSQIFNKPMCKGWECVELLLMFEFLYCFFFLTASVCWRWTVKPVYSSF